MLKSQIQGTVLLAIIAIAVSGCGSAESSEYEAVTAEQVAQAEAVQLKPKPLGEYLADQQDAAIRDTPTGSDVTTNQDANSTDTTGNKNADNVAVTDANATGVQKTNPGGADDTGSTPAVSQKGAAFLERNRLKNRFKKVEAREVKLLVPDRKFKTTGPEDAIRVSFDDVDLLKVLNMDPVPATAPELFPEWLKQLDGKRVRIRGYMYPAYRDTGLRAFVVARDNQICCFGKFPKIYDLMNVLMRKGETTDYIQGRPFDVVGVMHIEEAEFAGEMFWMDDAIVISD
jgi:hypothetical protein